MTVTAIKFHKTFTPLACFCGKVNVPALESGGLAVHRGLAAAPRFTDDYKISHASSGLSCGYCFLTRRDALSAAKKLLAMPCMDWTQSADIVHKILNADAAIADQVRRIQIENGGFFLVWWSEAAISKPALFAKTSYKPANSKI